MISFRTGSCYRSFLTLLMIGLTSHLLIAETEDSSEEETHPNAAGAPLAYEEFAARYVAPAAAVFTAPRFFTLRVGYARLPEKVEELEGITETDTPPEIFREHMVWLDVKTRLYRKDRNQESEYVTKNPAGESLPRPHHQGKWAYFLPKQIDEENVLCTIYFHHSKVVGWDYFLNLPHGARLDQTTFHEEIELPIGQWLILSESAMEENATTKRPDSYLYHLLYLQEVK